MDDEHDEITAEEWGKLERGLQLEAAGRNLADAVGAYYLRLREVGVPARTAYALTRAYQDALLRPR